MQKVLKTKMVQERKFYTLGIAVCGAKFAFYSHNFDLFGNLNLEGTFRKECCKNDYAGKEGWKRYHYCRICHCVLKLLETHE